MPLSLLARLGRSLETASTDAHQTGDVAVILGGHPRVRVPAAVDLLTRGAVQGLVLVGGQLRNGRPVEVQRAEAWVRDLGVEETCLFRVEAEALGTVEEAREVHRAAARHGWRRLLIVTSPYHCRRAAQVFNTELQGTGIEAIVIPTPYDDWSPERWHTDPRQRRLVARELVKMLLWKTGLRRLVRPGAPR